MDKRSWRKRLSMFEQSRRTILKGAAALTMVAAMPRIAQAREPSVLMFDAGDDIEDMIARFTKRRIQQWHAVDVDIISDFGALLNQIERKRHSFLMLDPRVAIGDLFKWKRRVRQHDPDLPILFNSSQLPDALPRAAFEGVATEFLQRPFGIRQLKPIVGRYLDAHPFLMPMA
jgi:DNA-binding NtrC family response regulator